jgi:hypothetical protein
VLLAVALPAAVVVVLPWAPGAALPSAALAVTVAGLVTWRSPADAVTVLAAVAWLSFLIPARFVIGDLGSLGTPGALACLACAGLWVAGRVHPSLRLAGRAQPARVVLMVFAASHLVSYLVATARPTDVLESTAADRGLVTVIGMTGVALLAADGIATRARLECLLRHVVACAAVLAGLGIVHFVTGEDLAERLRVPGLVETAPPDFMSERSDFRRVAGTMQHPIEFAVVLAMALPLAVHFALHDVRRRRQLWWSSVGVIGLALPMAVSRTAVVAVLAVVVVLYPTWPRAVRHHALGALVAFLVLLRAAFPGLLGTIVSLFEWFQADPSVQARQTDYDYVAGVILERPVFGRGFFTFLPERYDFIDNQYLLSLVEVGVVGTVAVAAVLWVGVSLARRARRATADAATRDLCQSLSAALAVPIVASATFDFLSFSTGRTLTFLLLGCAAALWRLERRDGAEPTAAPGPVHA